MSSGIARKARASLFALAAGVSLVSGASAATIDFVIDRTNSSVTVTDFGFGPACDLSNCGIDADLAASLQDRDTYTIGTGDTETFDFLTFAGTGWGFTVYSVSAVLSFSAPSGVTGSGSGKGGALLLAGFFVSGNLTWSSAVLNGPLPGGSVVSFDLEDLSMVSGASLTSKVTLTGVNIVPLPAGAILLISAIGGLTVLRRRNKAVAD